MSMRRIRSGDRRLGTVRSGDIGPEDSHAPGAILTATSTTRTTVTVPGRGAAHIWSYDGRGG